MRVEKRDWLTAIPAHTNTRAKVCTAEVHSLAFLLLVARSTARACVLACALSGPACAAGQESMGPAEHQGEVSGRRAADRGTARLMRRRFR